MHTNLRIITTPEQVLSNFSLFLIDSKHCIYKGILYPGGNDVDHMTENALKKS